MAPSLNLVLHVSRHFGPSPGSGSRGGRISLLVASHQCEETKNSITGALRQPHSGAAPPGAQQHPMSKSSLSAGCLCGPPSLLLMLRALHIAYDGLLHIQHGAPSIAPSIADQFFSQLVSLHPESSSLVSSSLAPVLCRPPIGPSAPA